MFNCIPRSVAAFLNFEDSAGIKSEVDDVVVDFGIKMSAQFTTKEAAESGIFIVTSNTEKTTQ